MYGEKIRIDKIMVIQNSIIIKVFIQTIRVTNKKNNRLRTKIFKINTIDLRLFT